MLREMDRGKESTYRAGLPGSQAWGQKSQSTITEFLEPQWTCLLKTAGVPAPGTQWPAPWNSGRDAFPPRKGYQPQTLYPEKLSFKGTGEIKTLKTTIMREFVAHSPTYLARNTKRKFNREKENVFDLWVKNLVIYEEMSTEKGLNLKLLFFLFYS